MFNFCAAVAGLRDSVKHERPLGRERRYRKCCKRTKLPELYPIGSGSLESGGIDLALLAPTPGLSE